MFGEDFVEVFNRLNWKIDPQNSGTAIFSQAFTGLQIVVNVADGKNPQANALLQALKEIGISAGGGVNPEIPIGTFEIRIGVKE
jgi:hypothetical protein